MGAALLPLGTTALALGIRAIVPVPDLQMLYLLAVIIAAARWGRVPGLLASALSVAAYDFLFVEPYYTLRVADGRYVLTFGMLFGVGWAAGTLAERVRREERERLRLAREAEAASLRARTEELRSSLLSSVSHDLRTPLAAITGAATTLKDTIAPVPEHERAELLASICEEAERMERLVGNLLDMTRLQSGAVTPKREWVPLEELTGSALNRLEARLQGREVTVTVPRELPLLHVDPVLFEQLLINLLENAARHTPPRTPIELFARAEAGTTQVEVRDRGPGLPPGDVTRLFEKFQRGPGSAGAGLGLAIAKAIAESHGGHLGATPREGGGAVFAVGLPAPGEQPP